MLHCCVAGRCGNTTKDEFDLDNWPSNPHFEKHASLYSDIQVDFVSLNSQGVTLKLSLSFQNLWASV